MPIKEPIFSKVTFNMRQTILWLTFILCLILASFISSILSKYLSSDAKTLISISMLIQDVLIFITPAFITASFITSHPLAFLQLNVTPSWRTVLFVVIIYFTAMPCLNYIIYLNQSMHLPESMNSIEMWMRENEAAATAVTNTFLSSTSISSLLYSILLAGVFAGFSEELFFRGALQRIIASRPMSIHIAIWFSAFVFSVLHFQFFGFFPRLILGALFGYMAWWTGSLWVPIIAHALNNSSVVINQFLLNRHIIDNTIDNIGIPHDKSIPLFAILSLVVTAAFIYFFAKRTTRKPTQH